MRLIDADAFIEENKDIIDCEIDHPKYQDTIRELIEQAPTVERPHGEWKYESYGQYLSTYKCSNCGFHGDKQWICCPYCGSDMRPKEGETE